MDPTEGSRWRLEIGREVASNYLDRMDATAALVCGSVSRGCADRWSDIEILVIAAADLEVKEQGALVAAISPDSRSGALDDQGSWWADHFVGRAAEDAPNTGVLVEAIVLSASALESHLTDVVERHDTDLDKQSLVHAILNGVTVHGDHAVASLRARAARYPDGLAEAMVRTYGPIDGFDDWRRAMERGGNALWAREILVGAERRLLLMLQALNRRYTYKLKWLDAVLEELSIAPANLRDRLDVVHGGSIESGAEALRSLIEDTYDLIGAHMPDIPVGRLREIFRWQRTPWDAPPPLRTPK
ncbi:MAG TPA: hypothetical protein VMY34_04685 [Acidimicrobiales bacterium]|nr:hypothetical protein [Acidimicrobiales bacterium]